MENPLSAIEPQKLYPIETAAVAVKRSVRQFRDEWINTGLMQHVQMGNSIVLYGEWIIAAYVAAGRFKEPKSRTDRTESFED